MLIDSHAHITFKDYKGQEADVLQRAKEAGVNYIINIGLSDEQNDSKEAVDLANQHSGVFATVGIHPHDAKMATPEKMAYLERLAEDENVVAIGETGLDYYYDHSPRDIQIEIFRKFIQMAKRQKLPLVVHVRDAYEDAQKVLDEEGAKDVGGVIHCYTGESPFAKWALKNNFRIGFTGIITFKKSGELREVAKGIPDDKLLVETDSPFLSPEPYRGKLNEPAYVVKVAEKLAEIRGVSVSDIERITTRNARDLFRLPIELPDDKPKIAYPIRNNLYVNITNECTLACKFCPKFTDWMVKGHYLKLESEPEKQKLMDAIGDPTKYKEIVFCGFGESTLRLDLLKELAAWVKGQGVGVRLDTDGLGSLVHERNIVPELAEVVDAVSVSLNAPDPKTYVKICPNKYGEKAYPAVKDFIKECGKYMKDVTASVVGLPNLDVEACRLIVEEELKVKFRLRPYDEVG